MEKRGNPRGPEVSGDVLVAGLNVRPLALSARRSGHRVVSVDCFGDRDHRALVRNLSLKRHAGEVRYSTERLTQLARRVRAPEVAYGADFENRPELVRRLASGRRLLGNPPPILERVRDPRELRRAVEGAGLSAPRVLLAGEERKAAGEGEGRWVRKRRVGSGGRGVSPWDGSPLSRDEFLQERISGRPGSILFLADGRRAEVLGISEMLVGRDEFGGSGFRYCGSLLLTLFPAAGREDPEPPVRPGPDEARRLAGALAREFRLVGLCGVDVVTEGGRAWTLEVNPRYTAAMELLERDPAEAPLFELHRRACLGGETPEVGAPPASREGGTGGEAREGRVVRGKAVLRARAPCRATDLLALEGLEVADVPEPGEEIPAGGPVCTVFASGPDKAACLGGLRAAARAVYEALEETGAPSPASS